MKNKINRRSFIRNTAVIGTSSFFAGRLFSPLIGRDKSSPIEYGFEISVVRGENILESTMLSIRQRGDGMKEFVRSGSKVAILPNAQRNNPGTYTKPDIVRAVIRLCFEAGAEEVNCLSSLPAQSWENTGLGQAVKEEGANLILVDRKDEKQFRTVPVPKGKKLKEAQIMEAFFKNDVFINIPITKDHVGNRFTGTMKNLMGLSSPQTNRTFHTGRLEKKPDDIDHLDQCIADLNTVIKPDLCVVDATEFIITNGPFGPGELLKPGKVVAGTDRVAIDAYCCRLWGLKPEGILMIKKGEEHGLGKINLKGFMIKETQI